MRSERPHPDVSAEPLEDVKTALQLLSASERRVADDRVKIARQAGENEVCLARLDIALALMAVVSAKVAIGIPSPEERKVDMIARLISDRGGKITKGELWQAIQSFDATSGDATSGSRAK